MAETTENPKIAVILSYIAGVLILFSGLIIILVGSVFAPSVIPGLEALGSLLAALGLLGMICGVIVIAGAYMIGKDPVGTHAMWGILILVFSLLSYFGSGGGFLIGGILGVIGGIMAIVWKPEIPAATPVLTE